MSHGWTRTLPTVPALMAVALMGACNMDDRNGTTPAETTTPPAATQPNPAGAATEAGRAIDGATQTMDVKASLMVEQGLDATNINVDTDSAARTVTLRGRVPTEAQKEQAERVATARGNGYRIINQLTVGAR